MIATPPPTLKKGMMAVQLIYELRNKILIFMQKTQQHIRTSIIQYNQGKQS